MSWCEFDGDQSDWGIQSHPHRTLQPQSCIQGKSVKPSIRTAGRPDIGHSGSRLVFDSSLGKAGDITSKLSERPLKSANPKTERGKILNPEYSICRDQPTSRASPLRINDLLSDEY